MILAIVDQLFRITKWLLRLTESMDQSTLKEAEADLEVIRQRVIQMTEETNSLVVQHATERRIAERRSSDRRKVA